MFSVVNQDIEIFNYANDNTIMCIDDDYNEVEQKLIHYTSKTWKVTRVLLYSYIHVDIRNLLLDLLRQ